MFSFLKKLFGSAPAAAPVVETKVETVNAVPYKVETPVVPVAQVAAAPIAVTAAPAPKKPAAKKQQFAKKPAAVKKAAPAKKPAATKPRQPKAAK